MSKILKPIIPAIAKASAKHAQRITEIQKNFIKLSGTVDLDRQGNLAVPKPILKRVK